MFDEQFIRETLVPILAISVVIFISAYIGILVYLHQRRDRTEVLTKRESEKNVSSSWVGSLVRVIKKNNFFSSTGGNAMVIWSGHGWLVPVVVLCCSLAMEPVIESIAGDERFYQDTAWAVSLAFLLSAGILYWLSRDRFATRMATHSSSFP